MSEDPPFRRSPDHLDPTEAHRLDQNLLTSNHALSNTTRQEILSSLIEMIKINGTIRTLNQLYTHKLIQFEIRQNIDQSRDTSNSLGMDISPEQDPGLPPRLIEFGVGITLRTNTETTEPLSFEEVAKRLIIFKNWYSKQGGRNSTLTSPRANPYFALVLRELTTLRHAEGQQMLEKAYRVYKPWEQKMEDLLGFSIEDSIYYTNQIMENMITRFNNHVAEVAEWSPSLLEFSPKAIEITDDTVWISEDTLSEWCDDSTRFHSFLQRLSVDPGSVTKFATPVDMNPLERTPFVRVDDAYMFPLPRTLMYSIANTFYYDLTNSDIKGKFQYQYGDWLEEWTIECLSKVFSEADIIHNFRYEYDGENVEGDILIRHDDGPIVIECKAKRLTIETRQGSFGGIDALEKDLNRGIGEAFRQADRLIKGVQSGEINQLEPEDQAPVDVSPEEFEDSQRWIILGESYGSLATRNFGKLLNISPVPYVCDIYDLQIMTEVLEDPNQLVHYIKRRRKHTINQTRRPESQYNSSNIFSPDEIDYLATYERNNGQFPIGAGNILGAGDNLSREVIEELLNQNEFRYTI